MQFRHKKNVIPAQPGISRITAMSFSPGPRQRLAIADANRTVYIYDENGLREDKFHTKAFDPTAKGKPYMVKGLSWAADGTRLAVAQTDNCLFIYKIPLDPKEKKAIWNRFATKAAVDCVVWPNVRFNEVVFGLGDGDVKIGNCVKSGKAQTLYSSQSPCIAIAAKLDGGCVVTSHIDGSLWRFRFDDTGTSREVAHAKIATHPCVAYALAWGETIIAAGPDMKVYFYDENGRVLQHFDYSPTSDIREMTIAAVNPSGFSCVIGSWDQFRSFNYNGRQSRWEEGDTKVIEHVGAVTALNWRQDGQTLAVGTMRGSVDLYDTCIRRYTYKGRFEFAYISHNNVVVKFIRGANAGGGLVLQSQFLHEIVRVSVFQDRYIVSHTPTTLLLGDVIEEKLAEIPWTSGGNEKYVFDNPGVALVYNAGELSLVQYGVNEVLGTVRTDYISPHLLSVRIIEPKEMEKVANQKEVRSLQLTSAPAVKLTKAKKIIAHLIDRQTIRVFDLVSSMAIGSIHHDAKIDWLELNGRCSKLLFRDKNRQLLLYDLISQAKTTLLNFCSYVQWVPNSDVVVAQNRGDLCVWYNIEAPERVWATPIKGDIEMIERASGKTKVTVDEGSNLGFYYLDEALIEFGSAMEDKNYTRAVDLLDMIAVNPTTEAMWASVAKAALDSEELQVAERCFAALGDVARAYTLNEINRMARDAVSAMATQGNDNYNGYAHYTARAHLAVLNGNFKQAESIYTDQGQNDEAVLCWAMLRRFDKAIDLMLAKRMDGADEQRVEYIRRLESEQRMEEAAELYLRDSKYKKAIEMFLNGGMPARAAHVVLDHNVDIGKDLLEPIAALLAKARMYEKAGVFFEKLKVYDRALDMYTKGHAYRPAVELARKHFPDYVCKLEEQWGDWLVSQACHDQAVNHYVEAQANVKAVEAAMHARHWKAAIRIVDAMPSEDEVTKRFYRLIASHFEGQRLYADAEKYFLKCGEREAAVKMYTRTNQWEQAHKVAKTYMSEEEVKVLYIEQARQLEAAGHYKDAERLYCRVQGWDQAIGMYRKARLYDDMIRLVHVYHPDLVTKTHQTLAHSLRREGQLKQAEHHFVAAKDWKTAVNTYCEANMWEDAIRVAKRNGGVNASSLVILAWAVQLKGEAGVRLLQKFGLVERAIDYAVELCHFDHAKEVAHMAMKSKLPYVHLKHAMFLEDDGKFKEAEEEFIRANKPKEAVEMYVEEQDWVNAMRVADTYDPPAVADVYVAQARVAFERQDYSHAEAFLLKAQRPELLVKIYCDAKMFEEARKIAKEHCPDRLASIVDMMIGGEDDPIKAGDMLLKEGQNYSRAIDQYLLATVEHESDEDALAAVWLRAIEVAASHAKDKLLATLRAASAKLCGINRFAVAAQQWAQFEFLKEAIDTYVRGGESPAFTEVESKPLWDAAQRIAEELSADAAKRVVTARREFFERTADGDRPFAAGNVELALELWAKASQWDKVMTNARKQPKEIRLKYSAQYVQFLISGDDYLGALEVATEDGFHTSLVYFPIYQTLFYGVIGDEDRDDEETQVWSNKCALWHIPVAVDIHRLRDKLKELYEAVKAAGPSPELLAVERIWWIVYFHSLAEIHKSNGFPELAARCLVAVCRYMPPMPSDKAFYDAGLACREVDWSGAAFVLLQRFLDVVESAEDSEQTAADLDHADFEKFNIPQTFPFPRRRVIEKPLEEDIRDWVLTASLDKNIEKEFKTVNCTPCGEPMCEFSTQCMSCQKEYTMCVVTGGPILNEKDITRCKACGCTADRDDWNRHIEKSKVCPICQNSQTPNYGR